jgi:hypothetical protein
MATMIINLEFHINVQNNCNKFFIVAVRTEKKGDKNNTGTTTSLMKFSLNGTLVDSIICISKMLNSGDMLMKLLLFNNMVAGLQKLPEAVSQRRGLEYP